MKRLSFLSIAAATVVALSAANPNSAVADEPTYSGVYAFGSNALTGVSALARTDDGVSMTLMTTGLAPGAYTVWWVVFNPDVPGMSVGFAAGHVVGPNGMARFAATLKEGEPLSIAGGPLEDARGADIHLVVRYHGPVDPLHLYDQLHTFEPGIAVNVQYSVHEAP
jgi:hypothetical protein